MPERRQPLWPASNLHVLCRAAPREDDGHPGWSGVSRLRRPSSSGIPGHRLTSREAGVDDELKDVLGEHLHWVALVGIAIVGSAGAASGAPANPTVSKLKLMNHWVSENGTYTTGNPGVAVDGNGVVHLSGSIGGGSSSTEAFALPSGDAPASNIYIDTYTVGGTVGFPVDFDVGCRVPGRVGRVGVHGTGRDLIPVGRIGPQELVPHSGGWMGFGRADLRHG
jgi:hypothetical protein